MASNIKYPEDHAMWFIEGDKLALITDVSNSGNTMLSVVYIWIKLEMRLTLINLQ